MRRSAGLLGVPMEDEGAAEIARRSRGTPRIANRLLRRVRDYSQVRSDGRITATSRETRSTCTKSTRTGWTRSTAR
ncbi:MAG: hypothetical protein R2724_12905 [Bryobacterales bacterium]